ncbi:MAG TPA: methyltransferase domain-containing protein [Steroidobacteraceae bacterium]|jgi:SAM-dependent methyltransferase|nr:methyltransferase domain-containing protein [Steroidobacteraceae bacterium]
MGTAHEDPDLRHLQRTPVGAQYVSQITAQESDRRARAAYRELVLRTVPAGAALFDFGAGPGIDARFFGERGFTVDAYDVDPRMRKFFAEHCAQLMAGGRVRLDGRSYAHFLTGTTPEPRQCVDLVLSNFAPLNLVDDLGGLFEKFHALTAPQGKVLASVLNPCFIAELRSRWWWRGAPRLWRDGELFLPGPQAPHYRRLLRHYRAASAPHFQLSRVYGCDLRRGGRLAPLQLAACRYLFLLFERSAGP